MSTLDELYPAESEEDAQELAEAVTLGEAMACPHTLVLARSYLALVTAGDAAPARDALAEHEERLCLHSRMEAHLVLHRATGEPEQLGLARDLLESLLEHAPSTVRETMRKNVPLHREILNGAHHRRSERRVGESR